MLSSFFYGVSQTLQHTPWWVYLIFFYCIFVGVKGLKGGVVPFSKMLIMPIVFTWLSVHSLLNNFQLTVFILSTYIGSLIIGALLGLLQAHSVGVKVDRQKWLLKLPGTSITLIVVMIIFFSKYYFGYAISTDPKLLTNTAFEFAMLFVSGATSGLFIGRTAYYFYLLHTGPSVELSED